MAAMTTSMKLAAAAWAFDNAKGRDCADFGLGIVRRSGRRAIVALSR